MPNITIVVCLTSGIIGTLVARHVIKEKITVDLMASLFGM